MKNSEKASIVFIITVSVIASYLIASIVIGSPNSETKKVDTISPITTEVVKPDSSIFNKDAINPTVEVVIGNKS